MKKTVIYDPDTGKILGRLTISENQLAHQSNVIEINDELAQRPLYCMKVRLLTKRLIDKNEVKVSADKTTFTANGTDKCTITFSGLTGAADLLVNHAVIGQVTPADASLDITSDTPKSFIVQAVSLDDYSLPITVTAQ